MGEGIVPLKLCKKPEFWLAAAAVIGMDDDVAVLEFADIYEFGLWYVVWQVVFAEVYDTRTINRSACGDEDTVAVGNDVLDQRLAFDNDGIVRIAQEFQVAPVATTGRA